MADMLFNNREGEGSSSNSAFLHDSYALDEAVDLAQTRSEDGQKTVRLVPPDCASDSALVAYSFIRIGRVFA